MAPSELPVVIATTTDARKAVPPVISSPSSAEGLVVADLALNKSFNTSRLLPFPSASLVPLL
ncbi:hypothetical protein BC936DRAFT_138554 [Jimgerdemannia flammicorona]|uniref:Uncharacterized protein n=1 Tax=Jimgerdemannia flammicorona TaxID=994334 RepID=A0A433C4T3_9FUNG|nr:hypothetical protein BC936DRAFT_138554 [Jimgerdemannia flammicorona]